MLKLFHYAISPYGWIARMTLHEKGLPFESVEPYDRAEDPELSRYNPINRTPTLVADGKGVYESMAIAEFLEERYPDPPLLPRDPWERARVRALCSMVLLDVLPEVAKIGRAVLDFASWDPRSGQAPPMKPAAEVNAAMRDEGVAGTSRVLGRLVKAADLSPWLAGPFSLADIALTPWVTALSFRGYTPPEELAPVWTWLSDVRKRPSYAASKPPYVS